MRMAAWVAVVVGAVGSAGLTLYTGGSGFVLMALFAGWVLLPYVAMGLVARLRALALVIAPVSLAIYARVAFGPPRPQPAFWFLMAPLGAWIAIGVIAVAGRQRGRS